MDVIVVDFLVRSIFVFTASLVWTELLKSFNCILTKYYQ